MFSVLSVIVTNTVFISINNIHVIRVIKDVIAVVTTAPVSPPVTASLHVARAARGEAEGVYDHVSLVGADRHQLVVHVLLPAHGHVSGEAAAVARLALPVADGDLHQLGQLRPVLGLVDDVHHLSLLVPGLPGHDVAGAAPAHGLRHEAAVEAALGRHHVSLHRPRLWTSRYYLDI